jgi:lysophospholipase L1-like esterase
MSSACRDSARRFAPFLVLCALLCGPVLSSADDKKPASDAVTPAPRKDKGWLQRHGSFVVRAKQGNVDVLFLGDSITQAWENQGKEIWKKRYEPMHAANFGIGGDRTQHVLWRIKEGHELDGIQPRAVVLMIGTNNMGDSSVDQIADGVTAIVKELHSQLPDAKVLLLGIFPRAAKPTDNLRAKIKEVNEKIARLDDGKEVRYLDIGAKFLDKDGTLSKAIMYDYLHLTSKGYKIWADAIGPSLDEALKTK